MSHHHQAAVTEASFWDVCSRAGTRHFYQWPFNPISLFLCLLVFYLRQHGSNSRYLAVVSAVVLMAVHTAGHIVRMWKQRYSVTKILSILYSYVKKSGWYSQTHSHCKCNNPPDSPGRLPFFTALSRCPPCHTFLLYFFVIYYYVTKSVFITVMVQCTVYKLFDS